MTALAKVLAKRHLEQYGDGTDPQLQYEVLTRLLDDVLLCGKGSSANNVAADQEFDGALACEAFSALGLMELRCARCSQPAWVHPQPITLSSSLSAAVDGPTGRAARP